MAFSCEVERLDTVVVVRLAISATLKNPGTVVPRACTSEVPTADRAFSVEASMDVAIWNSLVESATVFLIVDTKIFISVYRLISAFVQETLVYFFKKMDFFEKIN